MKLILNINITVQDFSYTIKMNEKFELLETDNGFFSKYVLNVEKSCFFNIQYVNVLYLIFVS